MSYKFKGLLCLFGFVASSMVYKTYFNDIQGSVYRTVNEMDSFGLSQMNEGYRPNFPSWSGGY